MAFFSPEQNLWAMAVVIWEAMVIFSMNYISGWIAEHLAEWSNISGSSWLVFPHEEYSNPWVWAKVTRCSVFSSALHPMDDVWGEGTLPLSYFSILTWNLISTSSWGQNQNWLIQEVSFPQLRARKRRNLDVLGYSNQLNWTFHFTELKWRRSRSWFKGHRISILLKNFIRFSWIAICSMLFRPFSETSAVDYFK